MRDEDEPHDQVPEEQADPWWNYDGWQDWNHTDDWTWGSWEKWETEPQE